MSHLLRRVLLSTLVAVFLSAPAFARSVSIAWDPNTEPDLAGYIVRYGTASGNYTVEIDVGNRPDFTLTLEQFTTYYVAVEAYNVDGVHSPVSAEVVVSADYSTCEFNLSRTNAAVGAAASNLTVALTAQDECPWTASSFSSWITVSGQTANRGSGSVLLSIAANPGGLARFGAVAFGSRSLLVTQASASSCTVSATAPTFAPFPRQGGGGTISVTASKPQCTWAAVSDSPWLTFAGPVPRIGSTTVAFAVRANTGPIRQGHLTIAGKTFEVLQQPRTRAETLDLDGNGTGDLFLYKPATGEWRRRLWNGRTFADGGGGTIADGWTVLPADFNGDGMSDLFLYNRANGVWRKAISGTTRPFSFYGTRWPAGWTPLVADFNGDGLSDMFLSDKRTGKWMQCISQRTSTEFICRSGQWATGWTVYRASLNRDRRDDLLLYNGNAPEDDPAAGTWMRAVTQPDSTFSYLAGDGLWAPRLRILPVDFTGDGQSELLLYDKDGSWTMVWFQGDTVGYNNGQWEAGWNVDAADFNGDGRGDLFLYNPRTGHWLAAINQVSTFSYIPGAWPKGYDVEVTDLDGNGISDLVVFNRTRGYVASVKTIRPGGFETVPSSFPPMWEVYATQVVNP